jgi:hypothetical protein
VFRTLNIVALVVGGLLFGFVVPLTRLFEAFQPMIVVLSVLVAAVFVRLNRGMPSLEWKNLEPEKRLRLTAKIVALSRDYVWIVSINGLTLLLLVTLLVVGRDEVSRTLLPVGQKLVSALIGAFFFLCVARVGYVVWRDCDIMELQKELIDKAAGEEMHALENKSADEKIAAMKLAGLRSAEVKPPEELS